MLEDLREYRDIIKVVASNPICSDCEVFRIVIRPVCIKGKQVFQAECFVGVQVFHINNYWFGRKIILAASINKL